MMSEMAARLEAMKVHQEEERIQWRDLLQVLQPHLEFGAGQGRAEAAQGETPRDDHQH